MKKNEMIQPSPESTICDPDRLAALLRTGLLDSPAETAFDRLTQLAQRVLKVPAVIISLVDKDRQFFKSALGLAEPWASQRQTPLSHSFCQFVVQAKQTLRVTDAHVHPLVCHNKAVDDLGVIAYYGFPITDAAGNCLGAFAAIDTKVREWTAEEGEVLRDLAAIAGTEIALRASAAEAREKAEAAQRAEKRLSESEMRFRGLVNQLKEVVFQTDTDGCCTFLSDAWSPITGFEVAESLGTNFLDYIHPDDVAQARQGFLLLLTRQVNSARAEFRHKTRKHGYCWVEVMVSAVEDETGNIVGAVGTLTDISERQLAVEKLRESETRFRAVAEGLGEGLLITDIDNTILYVNARSAHLTGFAGDEMMGQNAHHLLMPASEWNGVEHKNAQRVAGVSECYEAQLVRRDGSVFWAEIHASPFRGADDAVIGTLSAFSDITARKKAEADLYDSVQFVQQIAHAISVRLYVYDLVSQQTVYSNRNVAATLGYTPDQMQEMGSDYHSLMHCDDAARVAAYQSLLRNAGEGETNEFEYRMQHRDGTWRWLRSRDTVFARDANGTPTQVLGTAEDITDRKKAEDSLLALSHELRRSNQSLEEFASVASHDLQEPLRKIQAFGGRLQAKAGETLTSDCTDYLERILSAAGRMQTLINDLLLYSRITTKAQPFMPLDLNEIATGVLSDLEARIQRTEGEVQLDNLPCIEADSLQMRQLLQNLIGNALKFHRPGVPPRVTVRAEMVPPPGDRTMPLCRLTIQDNGIGFDAQYAERVFEVFERLHPRSEYEGTGIGLAICRRIVERHGGTISAQSVEGQGATFRVLLPMRHSGKDIEV